MTESAFERLDVDAKVRKRAEWEAFEFTLLGDGRIEVVNQSYADSDAVDHTYQVEVKNGVPESCTCPYAEYHDGDCKHMVAVAIRRPLIDSATVSDETPLATDGGVQVGESAQTECPNGSTRCEGREGDVRPCFQYNLESEVW